MGQDKARLRDREGLELWRGRLGLLKEVGTLEKLISCRKDQTYLEENGVQLVTDAWEDAGPLGGIVSCLEAMLADQLLVLGVDLPGMTLAGLKALQETVEKGGAVFRRDGFLEPLVAIYPREMAISGRRRLAASEYSVQEWIAEAGEMMQVLEVPARWAGLFINVNDPAAWELWLSETEKRPENTYGA